MVGTGKRADVHTRARRRKIHCIYTNISVFGVLRYGRTDVSHQRRNHK